MCDDVHIELEGNRIAKVENACVKGAALIHTSDAQRRRASCLWHGKSVPVDKAIDESAKLLRKARKTLIFGLDNSTLETQAAALDLAQALGAVIDDTSSFLYGSLIQKILSDSLPSCPLSQVKDAADLLVYWGSNPIHSHPRHLSKFSYYSYTQYDEAGWIPAKVTLTCVDIRDTELTSICYPAFRVQPGGDGEFIAAISLALEGKGGTEEARKFVELVARSHFCVLFCGMGLIYSLDDELERFTEMVHKLTQQTRVAVIPMIDEPNMRGFNQLLYKSTGYVNQVSFADGVSHGREFSSLEQVRTQAAQCILIIASDPFSDLPLSLMRNLRGTSIICLDHFATATTAAADVVIGTAIPGLECEGTMVRMDGEQIALSPVRENEYPSEKQIIKELLNRLR